MKNPSNSATLYAARCIADYAVRTGILGSRIVCRPVYQHMGAVLADSVLQAGLNYAKVVQPRITSILKTYPHATTTKTLKRIIEQEGIPKFLQWKHREKISRFDNLVAFMLEAKIDSTSELSRTLQDKGFRMDIRQVRGVGPKTIDYMACLVGVDCIVVDRHIRGFAELAELKDDSYDYLCEVFSFAADLLSISRREFDASIWRYQSKQSARQLSLGFIQ